MAGYATVALEMLEQAAQPLDVLFVPVGGGSLAAGMGLVFKALSPHTRLIGVQAAAAPALARKVRAEIERALPAALGRVARFAEIFREQVRRTLREPRARRRFWDRVFDGRIGQLALAGDEIAARRELIRLLDGARNEGAPAGIVHLVGAGPGDPDLLTLKAHRLLQRADVVVYDLLVSPEVLGAARRDAERIYVGKRRAHHCMPQAEINERLISLARAGKKVVRLKGGDPFVFGRGWDEAAALTQAGVKNTWVDLGTVGIHGNGHMMMLERNELEIAAFMAGWIQDNIEKGTKTTR